MRSAATVCLLLALGLGLAACGGGTGQPADEATSPEATSAAVQPTEAPAATPVPPTEETETGTQNSPVPLGSTMTVGPWDVTVTQVNADAAAEVAAANQFNDKPAEGQRFVMVGLSAKRVGSDSGSFWVEMSYKILGNKGNTFSDSCGVIPNSLSDAGETFAGASVDGNLCFKVDQDQVEGALLIVEESFSFSDESRRFFALQ